MQWRFMCALPPSQHDSPCRCRVHILLRFCSSECSHMNCNTQSPVLSTLVHSLDLHCSNQADSLLEDMLQFWALIARFDQGHTNERDRTSSSSAAAQALLRGLSIQTPGGMSIARDCGELYGARCDICCRNSSPPSMMLVLPRITSMPCC